MLNKENYVPWSSRLLWYAKSRHNGKLIHNSIINGPYVRRMIPEPGDPNHEVPVNETFYVQTDDELSEKELKHIEDDDQAIQTILLGLPEDIYAAVNSCETAQEIWLRVQQMMKGSDIGIKEKKANVLNTFQKRLLEVDDLKAKRLAKTQDPLALMTTSNNPYTFLVLHQDQPSFNQNYMQQPMPNPEDMTDPTTAMNMALALMAKAFKLNYSTPTNNNQRISSNLCNRQIAQPSMNMGQDDRCRWLESVRNQVIQNAVQNPRIQNVGNQNGLIVVTRNANQNPNGNGNLVAARAEGNATRHNGNQIRCYNCRGLGHFARNCTVRPSRRDAAYLQTQFLIAQKEEAGIQLQAKEFDLMAAAADLDEIEEVNANCILMANLQQSSTLGTQTDKAPVCDSDGSAKKMALGYQNHFYLKQAQKKQQSLYDGKVLFEKHDPLVVHDSEETLQLAQEKAAKFVGDFKSLAKEADESVAKHKALELEIERLLRAVLRAQLFVEVFDQKDTACGTSANTKFGKQSILGKPPKVGETHALSKPVTSNSIPTTQGSKVVKNVKVIAPGMFRINPFKSSREEKHVPNKVRASIRINPVTVSQPPVITKKVVNSDSNGLSSTGVDYTKTRRPQPRSNTKNDKVPSTSKSSYNKNKEVEVEEHHRKLLLYKNKKHMSSECNNVKLATQNVKSKVFCAICKQCLISVNHDVCFLNYVNGMTSRGHNLFSVGQFCDSDLKVAFRRNTCFIRNLEGVNLLKGYRTTNLYTINLQEMASAYPICLMARASSTKLWLWHQRLSHLNFDTINDLAKKDLVSDILKFKYHKEHICPSCEQRKSKRASHPHKLVPNSRQRLHLLHMDLCGPMRIASINGKRVVERRNQTLVEAARTMLIFSRAPLFLWAEAIATATACFTQNRSIIHHRFIKTPYELINERKPDISFLHVFGALCYPKNDREDIGKLGAKGDIGFFIGYSADSCAFRVSKLGLQSMTSGQISSGLNFTYAPSTITSQQPTKSEFYLLFKAMYEDYIGGQPSATPRIVSAAQTPHRLQQIHPLKLQIFQTLHRMLTGSIHNNNMLNNKEIGLQSNPKYEHYGAEECKKALTDPAWIESMQEELLQFKRLDVWG
nr:integrase, catalytic region, zinc finger, CCHC-type, peptidase aspartic, catalytic [Tanacetum cinerariifolium]